MYRYLLPKLRKAFILPIIWYALAGAAIAAIYGIIHDQITYSISPEYFTKMKFQQFRYADFGFPERFFVAEVGALATWWVGLFAGWFMARVAVPGFAEPLRFRYMVRGIVIMFTVAFLGSTTGCVLGALRRNDPRLGSWRDYQQALGIEDMKSFIQVAYIHNASYIGGLIGLVVALVYISRAVGKIQRL